MESTEKEFKIVAKTIQGLEELLADELREIGAKEIELQNRAVLFKGDKAMMYRANYHCRTAISILKPIANFIAKNEEDLYKGISRINWSKYMSVNDTLSVGATTFGNIFTHSKYASLKTKDAIVDQFRRKEGVRPDVDPRYPDLKIQVHIAQDKVNVLLDSSGEPLFKRGYKLRATEAPLNEVLAAGMIKLSGWDMNSDFIDPMCGSGTLLIEAAMIAYNVAPGTYRKSFGFETWKDFDPDMFEDIVEEEYGKVDFKHEIIGGDLLQESIDIAKKNIDQAFFSKKISLKKQDFFDSKPVNKGVMITNPPYGERLVPNDLKIFYQKIGDKLKQDYSGFTAWLIGSNLEAMKFIGLRPERKIKLYNGPLECSYRKFTLYDGSKRNKSK